MTEPLYSLLVWHDSTVKPPWPSRIIVMQCEKPGFDATEVYVWRMWEEKSWDHMLEGMGTPYRWALFVPPTSTTPIQPPAPEPIPMIGEEEGITARFEAIENRVEWLEERVDTLIAQEKASRAK